MILTDYYHGIKDPTKKTRFDVDCSTGTYGYFERLLINKKDPNAGGLSFYVVDRPGHYGTRWQRRTDKAITKNEVSISSVIMPDPTIMTGYGDVNNTADAILFLFNPEWNQLEIFIARGQKNNSLNLFQLCVDGELQEEMELLRIQGKNLGNKKSNNSC